jgi:hypothetical protein
MSALDEDQRTYLGQGAVLGFELCAEFSELLDADRQTAALLDLLLFAVQPETVGAVKARVGLGSRRRGEVVLRKGDREGRVGGEDELGVALSPIPGYEYIYQVIKRG